MENSLQVWKKVHEFKEESSLDQKMFVNLEKKLRVQKISSGLKKEKEKEKQKNPKKQAHKSENPNKENTASKLPKVS